MKRVLVSTLFYKQVSCQFKNEGNSLIFLYVYLKMHKTTYTCIVYNSFLKK